MDASSVIVGIVIALFVAGVVVVIFRVVAALVLFIGRVVANLALFIGLGRVVYAVRLKARIREDRLETHDQNSPLVKWVEIKGLGVFSHQHETNISFITSLLDSTTEPRPILCPLERFQEPETIAYQCEFAPETTKVLKVLKGWVRSGIILTPMLIPPRGGKRQLSAVLRIVDADTPPKILRGEADPSHPGLLWERKIKFDWVYNGKGYEEEKEHREEARALSLKIAMAVAMADGNLDDAEGHLMQLWIKREIALCEDEEREKMKSLYNTALRESFSEAKRGDLDLEKLASRLNEIGEKAIKYEAMELCFDVMSADDVAHPKEMETLRKLATMLELDIHEIERMRDKTLLQMGEGLGNEENMLGIDPTWDVEKIKKHLTTQFKKWNARRESLPTGEERDKAQSMLDAIATVRKRLDGSGKRDG